MKLYAYLNQNDREVKFYVDRKPDDAVEVYIGVVSITTTAERGQPSDGPPMPHPVAVAILGALRRDFARNPDSVIALLAADDAEWVPPA